MTQSPVPNYIIEDSSTNDSQANFLQNLPKLVIPASCRKQPVENRCCYQLILVLRMYLAISSIETMRMRGMINTRNVVSQGQDTHLSNRTCVTKVCHAGSFA
jgi:hypothetical protein